MQGIDNSGTWYKGNLHTHTTLSDGRLSPREVADIYRQNGYSFLALTDHRVYHQQSELGDDSFLILPAMEVDANSTDPMRIYHIVVAGREAIGADNGFADGQKFPTRPWKGLETAQSYLDDAAAANNLSVFCHPIWSRLELADFLDLKGYFAIEVYNHGCAVEDHTGLSVDYWDSLLRRGRRIWGVATDDCHHVINDRCGGWVTVNCPSLTQRNVIAALEAGNFYASSGPEVFRYELVDDEVVVECSPVAEIHFVAYEPTGHSVLAPQGGTITGASYKPRKGTKYVRVECVDSRGKTAWTNPIFFD